MSTLRVNTLQNTSGVEVYTAKAWVNFNGTGTVAIRASGNVSSITDNGTGDYTVNFTSALADANYAVVATPSAGSVNSVQAYVNTLTAPTASAVRIYTIAGLSTASDPAYVNVAIIR